MEGRERAAERSRDPEGRAAKAVFFLLLGLSGLLFFTQTIPAFQDEKVLAAELRKARKERNRLEKVRDLYRKKVQAVSCDPQEALRLHLELQDQGLIR